MLGCSRWEEGNWGDPGVPPSGVLGYFKVSGIVTLITRLIIVRSCVPFLHLDSIALFLGKGRYVYSVCITELCKCVSALRYGVLRTDVRPPTIPSNRTHWFHGLVTTKESTRWGFWWTREDAPSQYRGTVYRLCCPVSFTLKFPRRPAAEQSCFW